MYERVRDADVKMQWEEIKETRKKEEQKNRKERERTPVNTSPINLQNEDAFSGTKPPLSSH